MGAGMTAYLLNGGVAPNPALFLVAEAASSDLSKAQATPTSEGTEHAAFVVIHLEKKANLVAAAKVAGGLPALLNRFSSQKERDAGEAAIASVAFSPAVWESLAKSIGVAVPKALKHHVARSSPIGGIPHSEGDIFLHVKGNTYGQAYEIVEAFVKSLPAGSVAKVEDGYSFTYKTNRDLSGFQDGTMNVSGEEDRAKEALVQSETDATSAGGSFIIHQRWIHNEQYLHSLPLKEQEAVIGRTKESSDELNPLPAASHVNRTSSRVVRNPNGSELKIVRQSMPFGTVGGEHGLLFCAYSNDASKFDKLLDRMVGKDDRTPDALFRFSKCVRSSYWYMPNKQQLQQVANAK